MAPFQPACAIAGIHLVEGPAAIGYPNLSNDLNRFGLTRQIHKNR